MKKYEFDNDIYNTIRMNVKKYRREKGMTASQVAEAVGLSHEYIRQIESGKKTQGFSVETIYKISVVLGVGIDRLIKK